jgi:hypothetical protein
MFHLVSRPVIPIALGRRVLSFLSVSQSEDRECQKLEDHRKSDKDWDRSRVNMMALPANQPMPKPVSKTPNPVLRFSDGST